MKMRLFRDSLRFRLSKDDIAELIERGSVSNALHVTASTQLIYMLRGSDTAGEVRATFDVGTICVEGPRLLLDRWARTEQVALRANQPAGGGRTLNILIEKDFECLDPRGNEPDEKLFPNPRASAGRKPEPG